MRGGFRTYRFSRLNDGHQVQSDVHRGVVYGTRNRAKYLSSSEVVWRESGMAGAEFGNRELMELGVVGSSTGG